jgi:hypothetical protein
MPLRRLRLLLTAALLARWPARAPQQQQQQQQQTMTAAATV